MESKKARINLWLSEERGISCEMSGKPLDLLSLIAAAINQMYITAGDEGRVIRRCIVGLVANPDSPVWDLKEKGKGIRFTMPCAKEDE